MNRRVIANIKTLGVDMIASANSGHPGIVLGSAPILYSLFNDHIIINPKDPKWINRDRFVLSAGHGSALLYSILYMSGYNLSIDDLKNFRQIGSKTPGHPEYGVTDGVDCSTGPLGQGIANAVGMAIAEKELNSVNSIFNYKVYALCGDGDLMEGISHEAASLAGTLNLNNLIVLYDSNNVSLDGSTSKAFTENVLSRFTSYGWNVDEVKDGNDAIAISKAIGKARSSSKPTLIKVDTIIGHGSLLEGTNKVHGKCLTEDDIHQLKMKLNIEATPFYVDMETRNFMIANIEKRCLEKYKKWTNEFNNLITIHDELNDMINNNLNVDLLNHDFGFDVTLNEATRDTNKKIMAYISSKSKLFIGGSADLSSSTMTYIDNGIDFNGNKYGNNIWYGVREHAMGAISNGLALSGFRPYASTFLVFSDYLKPAVRMSALMNLPVTYIFSHDSITVGEDGPTHQPIEQLAMLRTIPNLNVYRPADANELVGSWNNILNSNKPSVLILTRGKVPMLDNSSKDISYGGYVVRHETDRLYATIIATGSEVSIAVRIANELYEKYKIDIRVVSMPCMELFLHQDVNYQESVIPKGYRNIVIEAGSSALWHQFVYNSKYLITLDDFGVSGKTNDVLKELNFDYDSIKDRVIKLLK